MQILEVSGRVCVKSTEVKAEIVKDMLAYVPPGIYIAIRSNNISYTDLQKELQLKVTRESQGVWLLANTGACHRKTQSKEPVLPVLRSNPSGSATVLPKQTPTTVKIRVRNNHKEVALPVLSSSPNISNAVLSQQTPASVSPARPLPVPVGNEEALRNYSNVLPFIRPTHVHL